MNSGSTLEKREPSVTHKNNIYYENNVNNVNKQQKYKFINSILKNSVTSKMNNSIAIGKNIHQNIGSDINFKVKNKYNYLINELNPPSIDLL